MLNFGNKEFRNLQEQVLKNAQDIETLKGRENLQVVIVNELPEVGNPNYIYLVAKDDGESPDVYDEYIWLEDEERYEKIGGVSIDLTNYVTTNTAQTITGKKKFTDEVYVFGNMTWSDQTDPSTYWSIKQDNYNNLLVSRVGSNKYMFTNSFFSGMNSRERDLGSAQYKWKNFYLSGEINLSDENNTYDYHIYAGTDGLLYFKRGTSSYALAMTQTIVYSRTIIPAENNTMDLGSSSFQWKNFYLTGYISDGVNTVSVANIASKVTSTFISGSFDSNGESTIDTEQAGTPEGLFIFTYGNCQCFLRLTATMVQNADTTPIRVSIPMIYNSATTLGWLNITKSGYILILTITDGTNHVDSGYAWTLTKTNLL